ncbi:MAG: hypothetical protein WCA46_23400 [Actinocatenispora sp.]
MPSVTLGRRLQYWFDRTMSKGTPALVAWLFVASVVVVVIGGLLVWLLDPFPEGRGPGKTRFGFFNSLWSSLMHAMDPGTVAGDAGDVWYTTIGFAITIGGILIVTALIGVLTTGLDAKLADLRKGRSPIVEADHTVVLGWSDQVFTIISELVEANENQRRSCVAILADRDKVEMEDEVRSKLGSTGGTRVVCRTGDPVDPDDIAIVQPQDARAIIVLPSHDALADAQLVKSMLAVAKAREGAAPKPVVGLVSESKNLSAARLAGGPAAHLIDANDIAARLIVQTCRQSGLSVVYTDLLDFGGDEIYLHEEPRLVGYSYADALHAYRTSSIIGLMGPDGQIALNPPSHARIQPGTRLIAISEDDDTVVMSGAPAPIDRSAIAAIPDAPAIRERTLILGWNARARGVLLQLDQYVSPGSEALVVAEHRDAGDALKKVLDEVQNLFLDFRAADSSDRTVLESLGVETFDHIIALCGDDLEGQVSDSRTLATLLQLRDMEQRSNRRFSIVSEMADDRNRALAQVTQADDFIVSDKLLTLMMTQISENPHLASLFAMLFDADGSEIYLKPADRYVRPGSSVTFQTVVEAARMRGESAIGYRVAANSQVEPTYGVVLNPDKASELRLRPADSVIVLAED